MSREWDWMDELNEDVPIKKTKRIRNEIKRNKIKNHRSRSQGSGAAYKGSEGSDY
jgi:hypothetical protein